MIHAVEANMVQERGMGRHKSSTTLLEKLQQENRRPSRMKK